MLLGALNNCLNPNLHDDCRLKVMPNSEEPDQVAHISSLPPKRSFKSALRSGSRPIVGKVSISAPSPPSRQIGEYRAISLGRKGGDGKYPGGLPLMSIFIQQDQRDDDDDDDVEFHQGGVSYDDFNLEGISPEEVQLWSKFAPEGQRLEDVGSSSTRRRHDSSSPKRRFFATINMTPGHLTIVSAQANPNR